MTIDTNPYRHLTADIDPKDFELFCTETLRAYAEQEGLRDFAISHDQKIETYDGVYQIDVFAQYTALGARHKVLVECKRQNRSIERDEAADLYGKIQSTGAQKGILISTSGFQSGTVRYAQAHGIALWQICNRFIRHITASAGNHVTEVWKMERMAEQHLPRYFVMEWDCSADYPYAQIYPTKAMYRNASAPSRQ